MKIHQRFTRTLSLILCALMLGTSVLSSVAQASIVSTRDLVQHEQLKYDRNQLHALLQRDQAVESMQSMGVDPEMVQQRIDHMTADELQAFNAQVDQMQAGGGILGVVVLVFVILIVLDLLGTTDIFPAIHPINTK